MATIMLLEQRHRNRVIENTDAGIEQAVFLAIIGVGGSGDTQFRRDMRQLFAIANDNKVSGATQCQYSRHDVLLRSLVDDDIVEKCTTADRVDNGMRAATQDRVAFQKFIKVIPIAVRIEFLVDAGMLIKMVFQMGHRSAGQLLQQCLEVTSLQYFPTACPCRLFIL